MTTFAGQISTSAGDSVQVTTGNAGELTATTPGFNTSGYTYAAFRFTNVTIAKNATISAADVQIYGQSSKALSMDGTFYAETIGASAALSTATNDISGRSRTSASTVWTATITASVFNTSPDIKSVIQEVVNRADWVSGNALTIIAVARSASSCALGEYDDASANAAKLDVTYTANTVPDAPTIGTATPGYPGSRIGYITFTAPGNNGGAAITSYSFTATSSNGGTAVTGGGTGTASPMTITALTAGKMYTVTVYATNSVGNSTNSAASNSFISSQYPMYACQNLLSRPLGNPFVLPWGI